MKKQNRIVRPIALVAAILWTFFLVTGCSSQTGGAGESQVGTIVTVRIISQEATILDQQVTLTNDLTAGRAVKDACQSQKMAYTEQDGMYISFQGITSTDTDGWLFYLNDELPDRGANDVTVSDGDVVEFRYVNYDEAFAE